MKEKIRHEAHYDEIGKVHQKYMVVVPKEIRKSLGLKVGDKVVWENKAEKAELKPLKRSEKGDIDKAYGRLKVKDWKKFEKTMKKVEEEDWLEVD